MWHSALLTSLFVTSILAIPSPLTPDPAGEKNIGNGRGTQFIGGACLSAADCASTCCATLNGAGICSGIGAQFQAGKQGCGFGGGGGGGSGSPPPPPPPTPVLPEQNATLPGTAEQNVTAPGAAQGAAKGVVDLNAPGSQNVGTGSGRQFITGQCFSDADCASGCCAGPKGACSARAVANENGKTGCGFTVLAGSGATNAGMKAAEASVPAPQSAPAVIVDQSAPGAQNVGTRMGLQFITGQCLTDADCASGCCAGPKGACAARAVATENGRTGCGFVASSNIVVPVKPAPVVETPGPAPVAETPAPAPAAGVGAGRGVVDLNAPGSQNVGKGNGLQFITGQCFSNADCASGCCAGPKGACSAVAVANANGKTGCGFTV